MAAMSFLPLLVIAFAQAAAVADSLHTLTILRGEMPDEHLGRSMAGVGDVNGDGLADFLVGDSRDGWHAGERRCYLYLGEDILGDVPSMTIHQSETDTLEPQSDDDARFGAVVAGGRDVNGDCYDDMVITSPGWYLATGKIYYYHGSSPPQDSPSGAIAAYGSSWMTLLWTTELRGTLVSDVN
ncbi:MAG: integrin alpha, partial [Candidatus Eisenbacteria bacterium]|nr:integrin alpha [Candidatus Eisenbacteria bacterium]